MKYVARRERLPATPVAPNCIAWVVRGPDSYPVASVATKADAERIAARFNADPLPAHV